MIRYCMPMWSMDEWYGVALRHDAHIRSLKGAYIVFAPNSNKSQTIILLLLLLLCSRLPQHEQCPKSMMWRSIHYHKRQQYAEHIFIKSVDPCIWQLHFACMVCVFCLFACCSQIGRQICFVNIKSQSPKGRWTEFAHALAQMCHSKRSLIFWMSSTAVHPHARQTAQVFSHWLNTLA